MAQPLDRGIQRRVMLAKAEAREMARRPFRIVVEGADRDRGDARLDGNVPAEIFIRAVEPQGPKIGRHEVRAMRRQDLEADLGQSAGQAIALSLHVSRQ